MKWWVPLVLVGVTSLASCTKRQAASPKAPSYEYRVMSLMDMFADTQEEKVKQLTVSVGPARRTDMDAADYQEALNRLSGQGWELVTVNKSNYWVFRRPRP